MRKNYTLSLDTEVMEKARETCGGMVPLSRFVQNAVERVLDQGRGSEKQRGSE